MIRQIEAKEPGGMSQFPQEGWKSLIALNEESCALDLLENLYFRRLLLLIRFGDSMFQSPDFAWMPNYKKSYDLGLHQIQYLKC